VKIAVTVELALEFGIYEYKKTIWIGVVDKCHLLFASLIWLALDLNRLHPDALL
jgi:hypothetical protein